MAITFVAAGTEGFGNAANATCGLPAGVVADDILIACGTWTAVAAAAPTMTGDWTSFLNTAGGFNPQMRVWWHRRAGVNPSGVMTFGGAEGLLGGICAFRGCVISGSPIDQAGSFTVGVDASIEHAAITPSVDDSCVLILNGSEDDNVRTLISPYINIFEDTVAAVQNAFVVTTPNPDISLHASYRILTGGSGVSQNPGAMTQAAADPWVSVLFNLKPLLTVPPVGTLLAGIPQSPRYSPGPQFLLIYPAASSALIMPPYRPR